MVASSTSSEDPLSIFGLAIAAHQKFTFAPFLSRYTAKALPSPFPEPVMTDTLFIKDAITGFNFVLWSVFSLFYGRKLIT